MVRSTIQPFGQDHKSADLIGTFTIQCRDAAELLQALSQFRSLIPLSTTASSKGKHAEQCRHDENAPIAILMSAG